MKTYEEMARDVLKRRDEELQKLEALQQTTQFDAPPETVYPASSKKRRLLPAIAIPCAAAIAIGAVAVTARNGGFRWKENNAYLPGSAVESSESSEDQSVNSTESDDRSGAPEKVERLPLSEVTRKGDIRFCDDAPDYLLTHGFFKPVNPAIFAVEDKDAEPVHPFEEIPFTVDELSSYYGIEFDRLGKLHKDWDEFYTSNFGIVVYTGNKDSLISSTETYNGKKIAYTISGIAYDIPDDAGHMSREVVVEAVKIGVGVDNMFNPFDPAAYQNGDAPYYIFPEINGHRAVIYHVRNLKDTYRLEAIIEMGDNTLVRISTNDLHEEMFAEILWEFTSPGDDNMIGSDGVEINDVFFLLSTPEYLVNANHPFVTGRDITHPVIQVPFTVDELNSYFGIELDCLGKLHPEWEPYVSREYGMFVDDSEDAQTAMTTDGTTVGGRKVVSSMNDLHYRLENGGEVTVSAARIGENEYMLSPFNVSVYYDGLPSVIVNDINGVQWLAYCREYNQFDELCALIAMDGTLVKISASGMRPQDFAEISMEFIMSDSSDITPWAEVSQDGFADYINS